MQTNPSALPNGFPEVRWQVGRLSRAARIGLAQWPVDVFCRWPQLMPLLAVTDKVRAWRFFVIPAKERHPRMLQSGAGIQVLFFHC